MEAIGLTARWDAPAGSTPATVEGALGRVRGVLPRQQAEDRWEVTHDGTRVALDVGPCSLDATALEGCTRTFNEMRGLVSVALQDEAAWHESTEISLTAGEGPIAPEALDAIAQVVAPALLLLLGRREADPMVLAADGAALRLALPYPLHADLAARVVPFLAVCLAALAHDAAAGALPAGLLRHPTLRARDEDGMRVTIRQRRDNGEAVLLRGRRTRLRGETTEGQTAHVDAQQSLTVLFLYAEPAVRRLVAPDEMAELRQIVLGERALPSDPPRGVSVAPQAPRAASATAVILTTGPQPVEADVMAARAMARAPETTVLICPWYQIALTDERVQASGPVLRVQGDEILRGTLGRPVAPDVMWFTGHSGRETVGSRAAEQAPLERLCAIGLANKEMTRKGVANAVLLAASRRGVVTSGLYEMWGTKHRLEFGLRAYEAGTGRRVPRPETYVAATPQVPLVLAAFARRGTATIVKPAFGSQGRDLQVVKPGGGWQPVPTDDEYVVQEVVPRPFLVDGYKIDLRCHAVIDLDRRDRSGWIPPILVRQAGVPHVPADLDAELVNVSYQRRAGLPADILPLEHAHRLSGEVRREIDAQVRALVDELVSAWFWWAEAEGIRRPNGLPARRVVLLGQDIAITEAGGRIALRLLESNTLPQLYRDFTLCDAAMREMLESSYVPALLNACTAPIGGA